jgi:hypothetical protein
MPRFPVFSAAETESFRAAINKYRAPGSYEAGKWSVSPLNRRPEIVGEFPGVVLRDIALRTTDQMPGVVLRPPTAADSCARSPRRACRRC